MKVEEFYFNEPNPSLESMQLNINHKLKILKEKEEKGLIKGFIAFADWHYSGFAGGDRLFFMQYMFENDENELEVAKEKLKYWHKNHDNYMDRIHQHRWKYYPEDDFMVEVNCYGKLIEILESRT